MESIQEIIKPHGDPSTGKITERKMYMVGDKLFESREHAATVLLPNLIADLLNANQDIKKQLQDLGRDCCLHLRFDPANRRFETNWNAVLQCKYCDPISKKLAKDAITLGF